VRAVIPPCFGLANSRRKVGLETNSRSHNIYIEPQLVEYRYRETTKSSAPLYTTDHTMTSNMSVIGRDIRCKERTIYGRSSEFRSLLHKACAKKSTIMKNMCKPQFDLVMTQGCIASILCSYLALCSNCGKTEILKTFDELEWTFAKISFNNFLNKCISRST